MPHLEEVLQRLYDTEINITITMLWDGGFDFAFISYMEFPEAGTPLDDFESLVKPEPPVHRNAVVELSNSGRARGGDPQGSADEVSGFWLRKAVRASELNRHPAFASNT